MLSNFAFSSTCVHKSSNSLVVNEVAYVAHFHSYPAVSITTFVFPENLDNYFLFFSMHILIMEMF